MTSLSPPHAALSSATGLANDQVFRFDAAFARSLRFREVNPREAFTVVDANGAFFRASLKSISETGGEALIYQAMAGSTESPARITLVCAVLGRQRMLTVAQKATELGCVRIVPVLSDHSVQRADLEKEKPWAWQGQALKASRQCRRASVPEVSKIVSLSEAITAPYWMNARRTFFLDDALGTSGDPLHGLMPSGEYVLAVGPEGGWSDAERDHLKSSGAVALRLGTRVLRAETAVFCGLSVMQYRLGDLGHPL
jgi:16S rRNA (uracil1498-N3)-methyltransferase